MGFRVEAEDETEKIGVVRASEADADVKITPKTLQALGL